MRRFLALLLVGLLVCPTGAFAARGKDMASNVLVASGTCTLANSRISAVDGTSFIDFTSAGVLTNYLGHLLVVKDSAGRMIQGYIKAAGTGETYNDVLSGWNLTNWTVLGGAVIDDSDTFHTTSSGGVFKAIWSAGKLYKTSFERSALSVLYLDGTTSQGVGLTTGYSYYTVTSASGSTNCYIKISGVGTTDILTLASEQVLTPSATGVTIVSTKGGSTYNWANKNSAFSYNDASGYTYQIYKTQAAPVVSSGSVTQANTRLDLTSDNAFAWLSGVDLSAYTDGNHMLCLYNATGGHGACGWISSTPAAGETLDVEMFADPGFDAPASWNAETGWAVTGSSAVASGASNTYVEQSIALFAGGMYKLVTGNITYTSGSYRIHIYDIGSSTYGSGGVKTEYRVATTANVTKNGIKAITAFNGVIPGISLQRVTDPPSAASGGVRIVSTKGGATRSWLSKSASFSGNDTSGQTYKVIYVP